MLMKRKMDEEGLVFLATRVPRKLRQRLRMFCLKREVSMMDVIIAAVQEKLAKDREEGEGG